MNPPLERTLDGKKPARTGRTGVAAHGGVPYTSGVVLYRFHAILVACAVVFCLGFAAYEGFTYRQRTAAESLWIAIFFTAAGLALGGYLYWFVRKNLRA